MSKYEDHDASSSFSNFGLKYDDGLENIPVIDFSNAFSIFETLGEVRGEGFTRDS
jgi:hypothetical protein